MVKGSEYIECPVCGISNEEEFVVSNDYRIVKCNGCGLLYVNPRPTSSNMSKYFKEEYIKDDERVDRDFVSLREPSLRREAAAIRRLLPQGGRLLDVGAASGAFLANFIGQAAWQLEGVEPSSVAAQFAADRYGLKVHTGYLNDLKLETESYDVVTCLDTFYYLPYPNDDLKTIHRILKLGGLLACEIPGLRFRLMKNTGPICWLLYKVPARLNAGEHLFYYSAETLSHLLQAHGFSLIERHAEQSPVYGSSLTRFLNSSIFYATRVLSALSATAIHLVPKEYLIYRKDNR